MIRIDQRVDAAPAASGGARPTLRRAVCTLEFGKCLLHAGCEAIANCILITKCTTDCYTEAKCKAVIDKFGGPSWNERQNADAVRTCPWAKACCV